MDKLIEIFQLERSHVKYLFIVALLILISSNLVSYMNTRDLQDIENYAIHTFKNVEVFEEMRDKITAAQNGRHFYFISDDMNYINPYYNVSSTIDTLYTKLRASTRGNSKIQFALDTLSYLTKSRFDLMNRGIELQGKKGNSDRSVKTLMGEGKELNDKIMVLITSLQKEEFNSLNNLIDVTNSKSTFTKYLSIFGSSISMLILIFAFIAATKIYSTGASRSKNERLSQDELETIVRERTAEISQINNRLYKTISQHEETAAVLKQREQDYRILFEQAHDAIIIFDAQTTQILDVNKRACSIYGIIKNEFIGLPLHTLAKNVPETDARIKKTLKQGFLNDFQTVHYRKDGTEMLMEINGSVINFKNRTAILSINRDVTERILNLIPVPSA